MARWTRPAASFRRTSGSDLGLIRDQTLRDDLSRQYAGPASAAYLYALLPEHHEIVRERTPQVVADHIWMACIQSPAPDQHYLADCDSPIAEARAQAVLDGYMRDPILLPKLRFWVANQGVAPSGIRNCKPILRDFLVRAEVQAKP